MSALIKLVFLSILATLAFAFYGDDLVRIIGNEAKLTQHAAPKELSASHNLVNSVQIPRQRDGHYWADVGVNHSNVSFIVDTGASVVTLSYEDAKKLGIPYFENDFNVPVNTAGGRTTMAIIELDVINVDAIELYNVKAFVARKGMLNVSLLGMNFLNRMERFEFSNQKLIIEH